jgi:energy-converting hydrogenase Eha subunit E
MFKNPRGRAVTTTYKGESMIILGVVLLLIGFIAKIPILWSVGIVIAVIGVILMLLGMAGREIGGRRHYY